MPYTVEVIDNSVRLRSESLLWDDLWERSDVTFPTCRAAGIAQWVDEFAPTADFRALIVRDDSGVWMAALPLVARNWLGLLSVGELPTNDWGNSGDLLLDPHCDVPEAMDALVAGLKLLPWEILWMECVPYDLPPWKALFAALDRAGVGADLHEKFRVGRVTLRDDWSQYEASWTKNHRKNIGRLARKTERETKAEFKLFTEFDLDRLDDLDELLQRGFAVEDRSWKGSIGSSVLRNPAIFAYYREQARILARSGQLALAFLEFEEHPVAFAFGYRGKGVFHFFKWGYDDAWQAFSPGQQLAWHILYALHSDSDWRKLDFAGPLTEATAKWQPQDDYGVGRVVVAPTALLGKVLYYAYRNFAPLMRHCRALWSGGGAEQADAAPVEATSLPHSKSEPAEQQQPAA